MRRLLPLLLPLLVLPALPAQGANIGDDYTDQSRLVAVEGYTTISPSDLTILDKASAQFPRKAIQQGHTHVECLAQLFVNDAGRVEDVLVLTGCPEVFHRSVRKAARKWRFEPYVGSDGVPAAVTFPLRFRFQRQS